MSQLHKLKETYVKWAVVIGLKLLLPIIKKNSIIIKEENLNNSERIYLKYRKKELISRF